MISIYEGEAYLAPSGQWVWKICEDGHDYMHGAGFESEDAAWQEMFEELSGLTEQGQLEESQR